MQNTRLLSLLRTFSNKELRNLRKFVASPFYNQRQDVRDLLALLENCFKKAQPVPGKEAIFKKLYGETAPYDDHKVRMAMSFLLRLAEQYLVQQSFVSEQVLVKTRLAAIYRQRNLPKHFTRTMREARHELEKGQLRNARFFEFDQELQMEEYQFQSLQRRTSDHNLQAVTDNLDVAYFSKKLRQACLLRSHQAVYKKEYRYGLLEAILQRVEKEGLLEVPAIALYYFAYQSMAHPAEPAYFNHLKKLLVSEGGKFPKNEIADLYLLAINFCIKKHNEGEQAYLQDEFDLYKDGIEKAYLLNNGVLSRFAYRNVVTTGLALKKEKWVERFIYDYKDHLVEAHRESMFSFSLARLEFQRKNFGKALQLLQKSEYRDLLLNLAAKGVIMKIYFEMSEYDALFSHLEAMQRFIRRKNIIGYHRELYMNAIQFTRKLIEVSGGQELADLKKEIEAEKALAEKGWLLEQC
ncbi:MAG: hypothetical protein AAFZ15_16310 [Bacteroidota bacterium]